MVDTTTRFNAMKTRARLANAHADWYGTANRDEADIALEAVLISTGVIQADQIVDAIHKEGTTLCIDVLTETDVEVIEIDAYGNVIRGTL
jgi:hypothetical protein